MRSTLLLLTIAVAALLATSCVTPMIFEGTSMRPEINDGDRILVTTSDFEVNRGDIIQFRYPKDPEKYYMKRVVGLPGETIEIRDGQTYINGDALEEPYVSEASNQNALSLRLKTIPEGHYFVMGDNRDYSSDSRTWGTVERSLIEGRFYWTYAAAESN